jgi:hypothetical protein
MPQGHDCLKIATNHQDGLWSATMLAGQPPNEQVLGTSTADSKELAIKAVRSQISAIAWTCEVD